MEDDKPYKRIVRDGFTLDICLTSSAEGVLGGSVDISNNEGKKCRVVLASAISDEAAALRLLELKCLEWIASLAGRDQRARRAGLRDVPGERSQETSQLWP